MWLRSAWALWAACSMTAFGSAVPGGAPGAGLLPAECISGSVCRVQHGVARSVLRPSQAVVGYAVVYSEYNLFWRDINEEQLQTKLDTKKKPIPVVFGPGGHPYVIDGHHTLCCLDLWASERAGHAPVYVRLQIVCDRSELSMQEFEDFVRAQGWAYLLSRPEVNHPLELVGSSGASSLPASLLASTELPQQVRLRDLPKRIHFSRHGSDTLRDDPFRSLATFVRFTGDDGCGSQRFCRRAYTMDCAPFVEFAWAYYINKAFLDRSLWASAEDYDNFGRMMRTQLLGPLDLEHFDRAPWHAAANLVTRVCRGPVAQHYVPPAKLFVFRALPGVVQTEGQVLQHDPKCAALVAPRQCAVAARSFLSRGRRSSGGARIEDTRGLVPAAVAP